MMRDCHKEIEDLYVAGVLNDYGKTYLESICDEGLDDALWEEALDDMHLASILGVSSDEEFRLFFYIDTFAEDLVEEIFGVRLSEDEEDSLKVHMFSLRNEVNFNNLVTFRVAVLKWLKAHNKLEKSSVRGTHTRPEGGRPYYLKRYNMESWARLVNLINKSLAFGISKSSALQDAVKQIQDNVERLDFLAWYNFKFGNAKNLYDINKDIQQGREGVTAMKKTKDKFAGIYEDAASYYVPKEVFKRQEAEQAAVDMPMTEYDRAKAAEEDARSQARQEDLELARAKLLSRTFAIDKLLQKHHGTLGVNQIDVIEDALNALRKQIRKLTLASTMNDCIVRTAAIVKHNGFQEGAEALLKIAKPELQVTAKISEQELDGVLDMLTDISTFLKQRAIVRDLAQADLELYDMSLAPMFPELTEAISKLIDAFTYASNKVDDIIPKIRGAAESHDQRRERSDDDNLPPLKIDKKKEKKEDDIPLTFPKDTELGNIDKEPKKPKEVVDERKEDKGPSGRKPKKEDSDLNLKELLPKEDKAPKKPAPKEKPKALLELEKAIKE